METPLIWRLDAKEYATEPAMIADEAGRLWLAWASRGPLEEGGVERIKVICSGRLGGTMPDEGLEARSIKLGEAGQAAWPSLVANGEALWVVWTQSPIERRPGSARLMAQQINAAGVLGPARTLREADAVRRPAAALVEGDLVVAFECTEGDDHFIEVIGLAQSGAQRAQALDRVEGALRCRPAVAVRGSEVAVVWEAHRPGAIELRGAIWGDELRSLGSLAQGDSFNQAPSLAWGPEGRLWIAYGSDARTDSPPTLSRWVRLRCVSMEGGAPTLMAPSSQPVDMALDADGEDQSLEFPSLAVGEAGTLWIVSRASHNMRVQSFGAEGWGESVALEPVQWGCRGTRIHTIVDGRHLIIAYHGRRGIQVQRVEVGASPGGPLAGALVSVSGEGPAQVVAGAEAPRWDSPQGNQRAFWGDIHFHSAHSDGVGTVEEAYLRCRDRYNHDFACLTDHDGFIGRRVNDAVWRMMVDVSESFHKPEAGFATLIGIEYTGPRYPGPGHKCLYFDGPEAPVVCRWDALADPGPLLDRVRELGGIAIPHHVGWLGGDPEHHDPEVQPCWEVCSTHGQYEAEMDDLDPPPFGHRLGLDEHQEALKDHFIRRQLEAGQVFGFVGGSDGHGLMWHHGISRRADSHATGLTGVWLDDLGRAGIMAAIRARRTWATSGLRMALACTASGHPQGAFIPSPEGELDVEVHFWSTTPWRRVDFLAPGPDEKTRSVASLEHTGQETECRGSVRIDADRLRQAKGFLYVRAVQEGGETAWASPWFWGR